MKYLFVFVIALACTLLAAAMVFVDNSLLKDAMICALGALTGFLLAYQMQSRFAFLAD